MIRIALVGVSGYGRCLLEAIRAVEATGRCRLVAACIVNRSQESELWDELVSGGVSCFADTASLWKAMAGNVDLTILPTPPQTHRHYTLEALAAGSHVLCEKPTAVNVSDAREMADAADAADRRLFVGFQDIYLEGTRRLKRELLDGTRGKVVSVSFLGFWSRGGSYYRRNSWAGRASVGGIPVNDNPVSNAFAHFLNLGLFFSGGDAGSSARPTSLRAELFRANDIETFDTADLLMGTDAGIPFRFLCSHAVPRDDVPVIRIKTERETLDWRYEEGLYERDTGTGSPRFIERLPSRTEARITMLGNIVAALLGETPPLCTPEQAMVPLGVSESLMTRPVIPFPPESLVTTNLPGDTLVTVKGLEEEFRRRFESDPLKESYAGSATESLERFK